jgi:hypothetical protein
MRPRPSEIVTGIRAVLADTIARELSSEHARSRLAEIRAVLAQVDWDNAGFALQKQCDSLAAALTQAQQWTRQAVPVAPTQHSFDAYQQHWEQLATLAVAAQVTLSSHIAAHPDDQPAAQAYRQLLNAL